MPVRVVIVGPLVRPAVATSAPGPADGTGASRCPGPQLS